MGPDYGFYICLFDNICCINNYKYFIQVLKVIIQNLYNIKLIALDEADDLLNDGISKELNNVFNKVPSGTQICLISATLSNNVFDLSKKIMHQPLKILLKTYLSRNLKEFYILSMIASQLELIQAIMKYLLKNY